MTKGRQVKNIISTGGVTGISLLISVLLYAGGFIVFGELAGYEGIRILSAVFETLVFFSVFVCFSVPEALVSPLARLFSKKQLKQAAHILKLSILYCLTLGLVVSVYVFFNAEHLSFNIFHDRLCVIPFQIISPIILIMAISACFKTYFNGYGVAMAGAISGVIESGCFLVFGIIFSKIGMTYGKNIGDLLKNANFSSCYAACGILIAFGIGQLISCLFLIGLWLFARKYLKMMVGAGSKIHKISKESMVTTFIVNQLRVVLSLLLFRGFVYIAQIILTDVNYSKISSVEMALVLTQSYGRMLLFLSIPFFLLKVIFLKTPTSVRSLLHKSDFAGMRRKNKALIHTAFLMIAPIIIWIGFGGAILESLFFPKHTIESTGIVMMLTGVSCLFLSLAYMLHRIALGFDRGMIFHGAECLIFAGFIGCLILFLKVLDLGILGYIYALLLYSLVLVFALMILLERSGFSVRSCFVQFIPIIGGSAAIGIIQLAMSSLLLPNVGAIITFIISIVVCIPLYWIIVFLLHGTNERELMALPGGKILAYVGTMIGML